MHTYHHLVQSDLKAISINKSTMQFHLSMQCKDIINFLQVEGSRCCEKANCKIVVACQSFSWVTFAQYFCVCWRRKLVICRHCDTGRIPFLILICDWYWNCRWFAPSFNIKQVTSCRDIEHFAPFSCNLNISIISNYQLSIYICIWPLFKAILAREKKSRTKNTYPSVDSVHIR